MRVLVIEDSERLLRSLGRGLTKAGFAADLGEKLKLILSNLVSNAVSHSRPGTTITCIFETSHGRPSLSVSNSVINLEADDLPVRGQLAKDAGSVTIKPQERTVIIQPRVLIAALTVAVLASAAPSTAEESRLDLGVRFDLGLGNGEPTNDIVGYSLFGHYKLNERWNLGFAVDHSSEFDFERTPGVLRLTTPTVIDAKGTSTTFSGWLERVYRRPGGRYQWFWSAGLGFNSVDVKDVSGPPTGGGTYDIRTDAGSEFQAMLGVGARRWFGDSWGIEVAVHADRHFADWKLTDRVSGATATIGDYTVNTINLGFLRKF